MESREHPQVIIYNIGAGAAKEINIKWDFDWSSAIKSIQDCCYRNSIPVVVRTQNDGLIVEHKGSMTHQPDQENTYQKRELSLFKGRILA